MVSYVEQDGLCALFGLSSPLGRACDAALAASIGIERSLADINARLGEQWGARVEIVVSIHAGRVALGQIRQTGTIIAAGAASEVADEMRKLAAANGSAFAISEAVFTGAGDAPPQGALVIPCGTTRQSVCLLASAPARLAQDRRIHARRGLMTLSERIGG